MATPSGTTSEWKVSVVCDYPAKKAVITVDPAQAVSSLLAASATALSMPSDSLSKYSLRGVGTGFDVVILGDGKTESKGSSSTLSAAGLRDGWSIFWFAPSDLKPIRKKRTKQDLATGASVGDDAKFAGLTATNVLGKLKTIKGKARANVLEYIDRYWGEIIKQAKRDVLHLPRPHLIEIIQSDNLDVKEPELFQTVLAWAREEIKKTGGKDDADTLRKTLVDILPHIRFPIMTATEMALTVTPTKILTSEQELQLYTHIGSQASKGKGKTPPEDEKKKGPMPKIGGFAARPRRPAGHQCLPTSRFEDNTGIIWWIGTNEGKGGYTNPAGSTVIITMSTSGGSASSCIFDRNITGSAAENSYGSSGMPWICCEFKRHKIRMTHVFVAQDQDHFIRSWRMECSDDGSTWTTAREFSNDSTLSSSNRSAFFEARASTFYRFIRLNTTGPGHNGSNNFDITEMEFFGYVLPLET